MSTQEREISEPGKIRMDAVTLKCPSHLVNFLWDFNIQHLRDFAEDAPPAGSRCSLLWLWWRAFTLHSPRLCLCSGERWGKDVPSQLQSVCQLLGWWSLRDWGLTEDPGPVPGYSGPCGANRSMRESWATEMNECSARCMHVYITVMSNSPFWRMSQFHPLLFFFFFKLIPLLGSVYIFKTNPTSPAKGRGEKNPLCSSSLFRRTWLETFLYL